MKRRREIDTIMFLVLPLFLISHVSAGIFNLKFDEQRIVNGTDVPYGKYPFQVSLQLYKYHVCSGSIVSNNFILTAAHCCDTLNPMEKARVVTSTVDLNNAGSNYMIAKLFKHPQYNASDLLVNDICLIKINQKFRLDHGESKIRLPDLTHRIRSGRWASVIGWGAEQPGGPISTVLKETKQMLLNYHDCSTYIGQIYPSHACSFFYGTGICEGDSGGIVLWYGVQVGVISWRDGAKPCAKSPAVFVQVAQYVEWINHYINN